MLNFNKRISLDELCSFIQNNIINDKHNLIGCVDININSVKQKNIKNTITKLTKLNYYDGVSIIDFLPQNLSKLFNLANNRYLRMGIYNSSKFTSLLSSVFICLNRKFQTIIDGSNDVFMSNFINRFKQESQGKLFNDLEYKLLGWTKKQLLQELNDSINNNIISAKVIKYLSDYLHINIFILDLEKDALYYSDYNFVPFKKTLFLLDFGPSYEPLFTEQNKSFTINDNIINHLINNTDKICLNKITNKHPLNFNILYNENVERYYKNTDKTKKIKKNSDKVLITNTSNDVINDSKSDDSDLINAYHDETTINNDNNIVCDLSELETDTNISKKSQNQVKYVWKLDKLKEYNIKSTMKLKELQDIATELNIDIKNNTKNKTKNQLIDEIKLKLK